MITIKQLRKAYGDATVLDVPNLCIGKNCIVSLVGNNGAGKTTLLRAINDLTVIQSGAVFIENEDISKTEDWKLLVSSYIDDSFIIPYLKPKEYFDFVARAYQLSNEKYAMAIQMIETFLGKDILTSNKYNRNFSKGVIQKIGIVAALIPMTEYIILDEPFSNLDPSSQRELKNLILKLHSDFQITFIISSHDLFLIKDLSQKIILLDKGSILLNEENSPQTFEYVENYFNAQVG